MFSEGFVYDIINPNLILDKERHVKYENYIDRKKRYKFKYKYEKEVHDKDINKYTLQQTKRINKISQNRQLEELDRGYDMLNLQP